MGSTLANPTDVTPGIAASLSTMSFCSACDSFRFRDQGRRNGDPQGLELLGLVNPG